MNACENWFSIFFPLCIRLGRSNILEKIRIMNISTAVSLLALIATAVPACSADEINMSFIFGAPQAIKASPELIDKILHLAAPGGNPGAPKETGRAVESEKSACDAGFAGEKLRTREVVSYSDGSSVAANWSPWDISACKPTPVTVISTTSQSEVASCDSGFTGDKSRSRDVILYSDGSQVLGDWMPWDTGKCVQSTPVVATYRQYGFYECGVSGGTPVFQLDSVAISVLSNGTYLASTERSAKSDCSYKSRSLPIFEDTLSCVSGTGAIKVSYQNLTLNGATLKHFMSATSTCK